jgi:hypothetical protein
MERMKVLLKELNVEHKLFLVNKGEVDEKNEY